MLKLSSVSVAFKGLHVLEDLDLDVSEGQILGILGPNGAGKTTLFNTINGNVVPASGEIRFRDAVINKKSVWDRSPLGISRTFQVPKPFHDMSVYENVLVAAHFARNGSFKEAKHRAAEALEEAGLADKADDKAGMLTLLDLKRLELAKALSQDPDLLLLDEIAGGLTDQECGELLRIIRAVHARSTTIVWIEHVLHVLVKAASELAVLYGGKIIERDTPDRILSNAKVQEVYLGV
ncbi:ATP-binding cassette domain-containing protein [Ruegeria sp.]|uniref:ABC transporter ATP-binding protein n=1 Tax=Ruegeria sp. TaxID=1879320 RepID=UPI0023104467|nr:ATP-binding cassette domain-containing protein [Ruegeria sp.]MDA7966424.1 ATP-binding cassette domain-containing protein [Ruegeria sp.]